MSVRRSLLLLLVLTLALPLAAFAWQANQFQSQASEQNYQYYTVGRGRVEVVISAIGTVEARAAASLNFARPGRVVEVLVQPRDFVEAGDVLARQASEAEQIAYDQALLALDLAELRRQDLLEPADDDAIRIAEANLNSAWGAYLGIQNVVTPEDIQAAEIQYQQAQQAYEDAVQARANAPGGQTEQAYQLLDAQVGAASFNAEIARLQLESLQNGNSGALNAAYGRVLQAQAELDRIKAGPGQAEIDQAEIAVQQAQADLDQAQMALDRTALVAPFSGVVSLVNVEVGSLSTPVLPAVEVTDISALHVEAQIDEIDIRQVRQGMPAHVRLDALPSVELPATLDQIALVGTNENGVIGYDVDFRLDTVDPRARVGMTAEASVIIEEQRDVLVVPNLYIRLDRELNRAYVNLVQPDGTLQEIEVELGLQGEDTSEVVSGLREGDLIAVDLSGDRISLFGG